MKNCILNKKRRVLRLFIKPYGGWIFKGPLDLRIQTAHEVPPVHENALSKLRIELSPQTTDDLKLAVQAGASLVVHTVRQDRINSISNSHNPRDLRNRVSFNLKRIGATTTSIVLMMHHSRRQDSLISYSKQLRHFLPCNGMLLHFCELFISKTSGLLQDFISDRKFADVVSLPYSPEGF